ncbi:MAG: FAD-binding protein [Coriobacteriales bacterium]
MAYAFLECVRTVFSESDRRSATPETSADKGASSSDDAGKILIQAQKVIIAMGGFCRNPEMIDRYCPDYSGVYTEVGVGCTGEGLQMGLDLGADYVGHGGTNGILACPIEPGQSKLIAKDVMWVASDGKRFASEGGQTHDIYYQVAHFDDQRFYAVYDQAKADALDDNLKAKFQLGLDKGFVSQGQTVAEAANTFVIDGATVEQSLTDYNTMCQAGEDTEFQKKAEQLVELATAPYYLIEIGVCTHGSFGGYHVNPSIEVLDTVGQPITNLYAAGEVSSGSFIYDDYPAAGADLPGRSRAGAGRASTRQTRLRPPSPTPRPTTGPSRRWRTGRSSASPRSRRRRA